MTHQPSLFDTVNHDGHMSFIARKSDPETSKKAAASVAPKLTGLRATFVEALRRYGGSATANELVCALNVPHGIRESIRKRAGECVKAGAVKIVGTRKCKVSGNECSVYEIV